MLPDKDEHQLLQELMLENQRLLAENNTILRKLKKWSIVSFWLRLVWTLILIGLPFVLYYYVIEPYFTTLGSSFAEFEEGLREVPGWKQFYEQISGGSDGGE